MAIHSYPKSEKPKRGLHRYKAFYMKKTASCIFILLLCAPLNYLMAKPGKEAKTERTILFYSIEVNIPGNFSGIEVNAYLRFNETASSGSDTLKLVLCEGFKGIVVQNIRVSDISHRPLIWSQDSSRIQVLISPSGGKLESGLFISYDLVKDTLYPGDTFSSFACEISDSLCHINAANTRTDNWYPRIAGTLTNRLPPFELKFNYPQEMELIASGSLTSEGENAQGRHSVWTSYGQLTDRSLFFYAEKGISRKIKNYPENFRVILYLPVQSTQQVIDSIADLAYRSYRFFEDCYGKAPGDELKVLAFYHGYSSGLNFAGIPMELALQDYKPDANAYPYRSFVHEISHTWWGNIVSANAEKEYWLYEGFARFSELKALEPVQHIRAEDIMFRRTRLASLPYMGYILPTGKAGHEPNRQLQVVSGYYEGSTLLHYLRYLMGEKLFNQMLKDYVSAYAGKCVTTPDFVSMIEKHGGSRVASMFSDYVNEPGYATYRIEKSGSRHSGSKTIQVYRLTNTSSRIIISDAEFCSSVDTLMRHIHLKPGKQVKLRIACANVTETPHFIPDTSKTFPFMPYGIRGGGSTAFRTADGRVLFFFTVPHTPLFEAGIRDGMELLQVEGEDVTGWTAEKLTESLMQPRDTDLRLLIKEGKGVVSEIIVHY